MCVLQSICYLGGTVEVGVSYAVVVHLELEHSVDIRDLEPDLRRTRHQIKYYVCYNG